jgi:SNF family Na+-dependent transporter
MLATEGIPVLHLELEIRQRLRECVVGVCNQASPYLGAVGISSDVVSCYVALYYQTVTAWRLFYLVRV